MRGNVVRGAWFAQGARTTYHVPRTTHHVPFPFALRGSFVFFGRMAKTALADLTRYCDRLLRTNAINDYDGAVNGLQVENRGTVTRIAAAVDASLATVRLAIAARADLLVVHHGLFWGLRHPWTGTNYQLMRLLLENDLAVYSSHLPLDVHPRLGNNAQLCAALGLKNLRPFFYEKEQFLGFKTQTSIPRNELVRRLQKAVGHAPIVLPGGSAVCRKIGIVTG